MTGRPEFSHGPAGSQTDVRQNRRAIDVNKNEGFKLTLSVWLGMVF